MIPSKTIRSGTWQARPLRRRQRERTAVAPWLAASCAAWFAAACGGRGADALLESAKSAPSHDEGTAVSTTEPAVTEPAVTEPAADTLRASTCSTEGADYVIEGAPAACTQRALPECPDGSQPAVDDCGCYCRSTHPIPRECRARCEDSGCEARRFEDFPDFEETLGIWRDDLLSHLDFLAEYSWLLEGSCAGGQRFLLRSNHYLWMAYVFDASGTFLAFGTQGDGLDSTCSGTHYFPVPVRCAEPTVTRVWSQDSPRVPQAGESVTLPASLRSDADSSAL